MRRFGARSHTSSTQCVEHPPSIPRSGDARYEQCEGRWEPENFGAPAAPIDPYAAWLEQREVDRDRGDHESTRWVMVGPMIRAGAAAERAATERRNRCDRPASGRLTTA